jgi:hypothetical protein
MRPPFRLAVPIPIRFRDTDAMGHVNNAVYLTYLEVARTAYWQRVFGIRSYSEVDFVLARAEIDYLVPLFVHSDAEVWIRVCEIGGASASPTSSRPAGARRPRGDRAGHVRLRTVGLEGLTSRSARDPRFRQPGACRCGE